MPRLLLLLLLLSPVEANLPTIEQLLHAYNHAGWEPHVVNGVPMVCIGEKASARADWFVSMIAARAQGVHCI